GYQYDDGGRCVKIPCQPPDNRIPDACRVTAFPCDEKDGYVWVWMGGPEKKPCPTIPEFAPGKWRQGFREVKCNFMRALEITYDSRHVYTTHPTHWATIAANKNGMMQAAMEIRRTQEGCVAFAPPTQSESEPIPDNAIRMEFSLPGRIRFEFPW